LTKTINDIRTSMSSFIAIGKSLSSLRSTTFFPAGKKKSDQTYRLLALEEKVQNLQIGKYFQLMDIGKINSKFTFTKPNGEADLTNPRSPMYLSMMQLAKKPMNAAETEFVNNFLDNTVSTINNASGEYENPQQILAASDNFYRSLNELRTELLEEPEAEADE